MCRLHIIAGMLGVALAVGACKAETSLEDYPCPPEGTKLTYETFGRDYLAQNCQTCHGQSGSSRKGAPSGYDFGTLDEVRDQKSRIFARSAADNVTMPPGPDDPPPAERHKLAEWLACGAP
jgi:mono/diheme cytochrome c family protein